MHLKVKKLTKQSAMISSNIKQVGGQRTTVKIHIIVQNSDYKIMCPLSLFSNSKTWKRPNKRTKPPPYLSWKHRFYQFLMRVLFQDIRYARNQSNLWDIYIIMYVILYVNIGKRVNKSIQLVKYLIKTEWSICLFGNKSWEQSTNMVGSGDN